WEALAPLELDAYAQAVATEQGQQQQLDHAQQQQLTRLRYQAELAQRQFNRVDPDNRLVAAELEQRWDIALRALKQAEEHSAQQQRQPSLLAALPPELEAQFRAVGQYLPQLWNQGLIDQRHKKALLRRLIDKVVLQRSAADRVQVCIVWKGGESTPLSVAVSVGAFSDLTDARRMEQLIVGQSRQGIADEQIAQQLSAQGYRSPMREEVLPSTVRTIRLKHRIFQKRSQSHPRRVEGYLTVPQIAQALNLTPHWIYDRIYNGSIQVTMHPERGTFLFPDTPSTLEQFEALRFVLANQMEHACLLIIATGNAILMLSVAIIGAGYGFEHFGAPRPTPCRASRREEGAARPAAPAPARGGAAARRRHACAAHLSLECN